MYSCFTYKYKVKKQVATKSLAISYQPALGTTCVCSVTVAAGYLHTYIHAQMGMFSSTSGLGDNKNFMSRYIMRVITIIDIIMTSF